MGISVIRATFDCDGCGKQFSVDIEPSIRAWKPRQEMLEIAEDAVRGGSGSDGGFCSIQGDMHLCGACTRIADTIGDDDYSPTRDEINSALDRALASPPLVDEG